MFPSAEIPCSLEFIAGLPIYLIFFFFFFDDYYYHEHHTAQFTANGHTLVQSNNTLPRKANQNPSFLYVSQHFSQYPCRTQQCQFLDESNNVFNSQVFQIIILLPFTLNGTFPNAPTTLVQISSLLPTFFGLLWHDIDVFQPPQSSGIATPIISQLFTLWSTLA